LATFDDVLAELPANVDGVRLDADLLRRWPGMDARGRTAPLLAGASARLGRPIRATNRGGASDASYLAPVIDVTIDGLGPRGGGAHTPREYVVESSLRTRAEVALALVDATLL
jgi:glutamate carboxypeptidase